MIYTYILQFKINLPILHFYVKLVNAKHFRRNKNVRNYRRNINRCCKIITIFIYNIFNYGIYRKWGPIIGSILGVFPQCGFSVSATNLYAGRVITLGTLIAVYLSTSDEMLPIFISEAVSPVIILKILGIKLIIGMIAGVIIDLFVHLIIKNKNKKIVQQNEEDSEENEIGHMCEEEHCHCNESGILKSAIHHTLSILVFIVLITFIINTVVHFVGEETIAGWILNKPVIGPVIASLIGLIPNCAASVIITNMYLENVISLGSMISGLLTGAGVGLAVLFKTNDKIKENIGIIILLYAIGVISGIMIDLIGITI